MRPSRCDARCGRVESVCGFKPDPDLVLNFLNAIAVGSQIQLAPPHASRPPQTDRQPPLSAQRQSVPQPSFGSQYSPVQGRTVPTGSRMGYEISGQFHAARNAIDVLRQIFNALIAKEPLFAERFTARPHARTRRYLARGRDELYQRPDLCQKYSVHLPSGWWMSTNHSRNTIQTIIQLASEVAGLRYGKDLIGQVTALAEHPCDSVSGTGGVVWRFFIGMAMAKKEWDQGTETTPDG